PVEQVFTPGEVIHHVDRFDDAPAHQLSPDAVDQGAIQAAVTGLGEEIGQLTQAVFHRRVLRYFSEFGKEQFTAGHFTGWGVAAVNFQGRVGEDAGKAVGILQLPVTDETVVAGSTFEI